MREFYAYRIPQRRTEGQTLQRGGRLFQQYIVDAYSIIEEKRLQYLRTHQKELRSELYRNVCDAIFKGDMDGESVGRCIVLPYSFTGMPQCMIQNFQDAMAIGRKYGNPHMFITFIANPKWSEVQHMMEYIEGQRVEDEPGIVCRVFKLKIEQLLKVRTKDHHFGKTQLSKHVKLTFSCAI